MTGPASNAHDKLERALDIIRRAARAGQPLTNEQLRARMGGGRNIAEKYVRRLRDQGLVELDRSCTPMVIKPVAEVRAS